MKKLNSSTLNLCLGLFCLSLFNACTTTYYATGTQPALNLAKKGDLNISLSTTTNFDSDAITAPLDAAIAYSPAPNIGLYAGTVGFSDHFRTIFDTRLGDQSFSQGRSFILGIGRYKALSDKWRIQTYGFANFGKYDITTYGIHNFTSNFNKFAIQESFALTLGSKSRSELNFSTSLALLNYTKMQYLTNGNTTLEGAEVANLTNFGFMNHSEYLRYNSRNLLFETAVTYTYSIEFFKIFCQLGRSLNLSNNQFLQQKGVMAVGLQMDIAALASIRNKKEKK